MDHKVQETLGGAMGIRTPDLLNAIEALYQLSYDPKRCTAFLANCRNDGGTNLGGNRFSTQPFSKKSRSVEITG